MSRLTRIAVAGALALATAPGLASAASGRQLPRLPRALDQRTMTVDITGVQSTRWTLNDPSENRCDPAVTGSGSERVLIRVPATRLEIKRYGANYVLVGDPFHVGGNDLRGRATVTRSGHTSSTAVDPSCGDNGGADPNMPAPDCGTKRTPYDVQIGYVNEPTHGFTLTQPDLPPLGDLFKNCPWTGGTTQFPQLLDKRGSVPIVARIPVADLFNRGYGQQIVIGRGSQRSDGGGMQSRTQIRWSIRLTRVGR
jgi:hypothetical protein